MGLRQVYWGYRLAWKGVDLLFPPTCGGCGKLGSRWCVECQRTVSVLSPPLCDVCGIPASQPGLCQDCKRMRPKYRILRSWSEFEAPVRNALHRLKYRRDMGLGDALAAQLAGFVLNLNWPIETVVPIPLGRQRRRERGYNQVALIAHPLALAVGLVYDPAVLSRARDTKSQVGLSREARRENVRGAFRADERRVRGRVVLLVDDVATTGSTLSSGAEALYASGALDVFCLTVSRALPHHATGAAR